MNSNVIHVEYAIARSMIDLVQTLQIFVNFKLVMALLC